jgi:hypothetical protein
MPEHQLRFEQWATYYIILSAAAATLLGLLFVVSSLAAERGRKDAPSDTPLRVAGGLLLLSRPQIGLDLVAAAMLVLLAIGIRNSWSIAITIVSSRD